MECRRLERVVSQALWNTWTGIVLEVITIGSLAWWVPHWGFGWFAATLTVLGLLALWMGIYNGLQYRRLRGEWLLAVLADD